MVKNDTCDLLEQAHVRVNRPGTHVAVVSRYSRLQLRGAVRANDMAAWNHCKLFAPLFLKADRTFPFRHKCRRIGKGRCMHLGERGEGALGLRCYTSANQFWKQQSPVIHS